MRSQPNLSDAAPMQSKAPGTVWVEAGALVRLRTEGARYYWTGAFAFRSPSPAAINLAKPQFDSHGVSVTLALPACVHSVFRSTRARVIATPHLPSRSKKTAAVSSSPSTCTTV